MNTPTAVLAILTILAAALILAAAGYDGSCTPDPTPLDGAVMAACKEAAAP